MMKLQTCLTSAILFALLLIHPVYSSALFSLNQYSPVESLSDLQTTPAAMKFMQIADEAANFVIDELNKNNPKDKETKQPILLELNKVRYDESSIAQASRYEFLLEFVPPGVQYRMEFYDGSAFGTQGPNEMNVWTWLRALNPQHKSTLDPIAAISHPDYELKTKQDAENKTTTDSNKQALPSLSTQPDPLSNVQLQGPLYIRFEHSRDDIRLKLPNEVDINEKLRKIRIGEGVTVRVYGSSSLKLLAPANIGLLPSPSNDREDTLLFQCKQIPVIEIQGASPLTFASVERIKVKRTSNPNEVEFVTLEPKKQSTTPQYPLVPISLENPVVQIIQSMIDQGQQQLDIQAATATKAIASEKGAEILSIYNVKRVLDAKIEAAVVIQLSIEMKERHSHVLRHFVTMIAITVDGSKQIISLQEQKQPDPITMVPLVFANSTFEGLVETFADLLAKQGLSLD